MMRLVAAYRWELWLLVGIPCIRLEYYWIESPVDAARSLADALDGLIIAFALVLLIYAVRRVAKGIGAPRRGST